MTCTASFAGISSVLGVMIGRPSRLSSALSAGTVMDLAERQRSLTSLSPFLQFPADVTYAGESGQTRARQHLQISE